jgi:hypothetical protein
MNRMRMLVTIVLMGCWNRGIVRQCTHRYLPPTRRTLASIVAAGLLALVWIEMSWAYIPFCWPASPSPNAIFVYDGANSNACVMFQVGDKFPDLRSIGWDDRISSMAVGSDVRVVLYEHPKFQGRQAHYEGGDSYQLGNPNNRTSSIEVFPRQGGPAATWYLREHPSGSESFWANDAQGLANDGAHWFAVKGYNASNTQIFKVPFSYDLASSSSAGLLQTGIPAELRNVGYDHFGDPDQSSGFLFVPLEDSSRRLKPGIVVFSTVDLRFLSWFELSDSPQQNAPWLAIRPGTRTLWVSASDPSEGNQIREYDIDWDRLGIYGQLVLSFRRQIIPRNRDDVSMYLKSIQGGVFNPEGTLLYTSHGWCDSNGYVHVFAIEDATDTARLQARSENGYGPFKFETDPEMACVGFLWWEDCVCAGSETEGLDWLDVRGLGIPGIPDGQLHLITIDNDLTEDDNLYIKHYSF